MHEEPTTAIIQRYLDALPGDPAAERLIRELLDRAVGRLRLLCASLLHRDYPRLTHPPPHLRLQRVGLAPRRKKGFLNFYFFLHTSVLTCPLADVSFLSPAKASVWLRFLRQRSRRY